MGALPLPLSPGYMEDKILSRTRSLVRYIRWGEIANGQPWIVSESSYIFL